MKPKNRGIPKFDKAAIGELFRWDAVKPALCALLRKETWQNLFSQERLAKTLDANNVSLHNINWMAVFHLAAALTIFIGSLVFYRAGAPGFKVLVLGLFVYFNVYLCVVFIRNRDMLDMPKAAFRFVLMLALAICIGIIINSVWGGLARFVNTCAAIGIFGLPIMMASRVFWQRIFHLISGAIEQALSGRSVDDLFTGLLGGALGLVLAAGIILVGGSFVIVCHYIALVRSLWMAKSELASECVNEQPPAKNRAVAPAAVSSPPVDDSSLCGMMEPPPSGNDENQAEEVEEFSIRENDQDYVWGKRGE